MSGDHRTGPAGLRAGEARPGLEPPPGNPKFPHLDGIRGLAALTVVFTHSLGPAWTRPGTPWWVNVAAMVGRAGLPCFFMLSGFLLYRPYVAARLVGSPRPPAGKFWRRRILRAVPAYWVAITLLAVWPGLPGVFGPEGWRYYGFVQIYSGHTIEGGLIPAWTVAVDMSLYLLLPFFALAMDAVWRRMGDRAWRSELLVIAGMFAIAVLYWLLVIDPTGPNLVEQDLRRWNLLANLDWLALGLTLAVVSARDQLKTTWLTRQLARSHAVEGCWLLAAGLFVFTSAAYFSLAPIEEHLLAALTAFSIFAPAALVGWRGGIQRILAHHLTMRLGLVSYGLYLYHGPLVGEIQLHLSHHLTGLPLFLGTLVVAVPVSLAAGTLSYFLVERRFLRLKRRLGAGATAEPAAPAELASSR